LYVCDTSSLSARKENADLRVFGNMQVRYWGIWDEAV
jgi:hypothetical protein